jgi:hypothetical protein
MKMNIRSLLLVLTVGVGCSSDALAYHYSGNDLNRWIQALARTEAGNPQTTDLAEAIQLDGYVVGVYDSWDIEQDLSMCRLGEAGQVVAVVAQFVEAHPEKWAKPAALLVQQALLEACKKNQRP